jgi:hypothetical protein
MIITSPPAIRARESDAERSPGTLSASESDDDVEGSGGRRASLEPDCVKPSLLAGALKKRIIKTNKTIKYRDLCMFPCCRMLSSRRWLLLCLLHAPMIQQILYQIRNPQCRVSGLPHGKELMAKLSSEKNYIVFTSGSQLPDPFLLDLKSNRKENVTPFGELFSFGTPFIRHSTGSGR